MALTTLNAWYYGSAGTGGSVIPSKSGQVLAESTIAGSISSLVSGFFLITLDGAATTGTVNWIDGTQTLQRAPTYIQAFRQDPPAYGNSLYYPTGAVVLGSGHVQQATTGGLSASSGTPSWSTSGTSVVDNTVTWKDMGAIGLSTITPISFTSVTNVSATLTISAAGTSTQVLMFPFEYQILP